MGSNNLLDTQIITIEGRDAQEIGKFYVPQKIFNQLRLLGKMDGMLV